MVTVDMRPEASVVAKTEVKDCLGAAEVIGPVVLTDSDVKTGLEMRVL